MLEQLHIGHIGMQGTLRRARDILFWPGVTNDIRQKTFNCTHCSTYQKAQPREPLIPLTPTTHPWERIGIDLFTQDSTDYMIVVDYYSNFPHVIKLN